MATDETQKKVFPIFYLAIKYFSSNVFHEKSPNGKNPKEGLDKITLITFE